MSEIRVGIIAEGKTDQIMIAGILKALFPHVSCTIDYLSPTPDELTVNYKPEGFGWGGVCKLLGRNEEIP